MNLTPSMSYDEIQTVVAPHWFSVRETPEPLHLHRYGLPLQKFTTKMDLCNYLNMRLKRGGKK